MCVALILFLLNTLWEWSWIKVDLPFYHFGSGADFSSSFSLLDGAYLAFSPPVTTTTISPFLLLLSLPLLPLTRCLSLSLVYV